MTHQDLQAELRQYVDPEKALFLPRFFKTGPGQYAEGDKFLGISVPDTRRVVASHRTMPLGEIQRLLRSEWHEDRLAALLILVWQYPRSNNSTKKAIYDLYISNTSYINNWDLVDSSADYIVGAHLDNNPNKMKTLRQLAQSKLLWERRIAMLATYNYIKRGRADEALEITDILLHDHHDLIQKATGWMLREIGKRVDLQLLTNYLDRHAGTMPHTTLRYAIEHMPPEMRRHYMEMKTK